VFRVLEAAREFNGLLAWIIHEVHVNNPGLPTCRGMTMAAKADSAL
jgi:hypothetical protein